MIVNLRDICAIAEQNNMAIASFNTPSLEAVRAALDAAEETVADAVLARAHAAKLALEAAAEAKAHLGGALGIGDVDVVGLHGAVIHSAGEAHLEGAAHVGEVLAVVEVHADHGAGALGEGNLDILACSFGTVHGIYKGEPHLSLDVLTQRP